MTFRRGACPTLSEPMQTGDGLLARLNPIEGRLVAGQLAGLARAAERFGSGIIELTARGNLQVRGLTAESAAKFDAEVRALRIETHTGLAVEVNPLAGTDAAELADPRGPAREIRERGEALGLPARLAPKMSVTVDGGGALSVGGLSADVKLEAANARTWLLCAAGAALEMRELGRFDADEAVEAAIRILQAVADRGRSARVRDLPDAILARITGREPLPQASPMLRPRKPVGLFRLHGGKWARGFVPAFGQLGARALAAFAASVGAEREIGFARGRGLLVLDVGQEEEAALAAFARRLGFVVSATDPRLAIAACAGKPACASAQLATRRLAERLAAGWPELLDGSFTLHLSGCEKQCARPSGPSVTLTGASGGCRLSAEGAVLPPALEAVLSALVEEEDEPGP